MQAAVVKDLPPKLNKKLVSQGTTAAVENVCTQAQLSCPWINNIVFVKY